MIDIDNWPISAGYRNVDPAHHLPHKGVDFAIPVGTPVPSVADGTVTALTDGGTQGFGKAVLVHTRDGYDVIYGHLSRQMATVGQHVHPGDIIGVSGNTGESTGPHLHLQVMKNGIPVDPIRFTHDHLVNWWDIQAHIQSATDGFKDALWTGIDHWFLNGIETLLPTIACIGIVWYLFPFAPKRHLGLRTTGVSLILYLFYELLKEAYL